MSGFFVCLCVCLFVFQWFDVVAFVLNCLFVCLFGLLGLRCAASFVCLFVSLCACLFVRLLVCLCVLCRSTSVSAYFAVMCLFNCLGCLCFCLFGSLVVCLA